VVLRVSKACPPFIKREVRGVVHLLLVPFQLFVSVFCTCVCVRTSACSCVHGCFAVLILSAQLARNVLTMPSLLLTSFYTASHMCTLSCVVFLLHKNLTCVHSIALLFCLQELQYLQGRAGNNDNLPLFFSPLTQPLTHFTSTDTALTIAPDCIFSAPCKDSSTSRAWMAYPSRPFFSHTPSPCLAFGSAASFRQ
jgi:hypothetical protein